MSQVKTKRLIRVVTATVATSSATSTTLRLDDMSSGVVHMPVLVSSGAVVQVWGNSTDTGTFSQVFGADGVAATLTIPVSGTTLPTTLALPAAAGNLAYAKLVATVAGATATASVTFKS